MVTAEDIDRDLAPLTFEQCAARGIKHSSTDDYTIALRGKESKARRRRILEKQARRVGL